MSWQDLEQELRDAFPEGTEAWLDFDDPDGPGPLLQATARVLDEHGAQRVDELRRELVPITARAALAVWERSLGVDSGRIAQSGDLERRRAQVLGRLRQRGAPTIRYIQQVMQGYLRYPSADQIVVLENPRGALRQKHTYVWQGNDPFGAGNTAVASWFVRDDPRVSRGGAQVDLTFGAPLQLDLLAAVFIGPAGAQGQASKAWLPRQVGRGQASQVRLHCAEAAGTTIFGAWSLELPQNFAVGTLIRAELFVEGLGRYFDFQGKPRDGLGAAKFFWGVLVEMAKLGADADLQAAADMVRRINYACRSGHLVHQPAGQPANQHGAIPNWPTTIPDQVVPGP